MLFLEVVERLLLCNDRCVDVEVFQVLPGHRLAEQIILFLGLTRCEPAATSSSRLFVGAYCAEKPVEFPQVRFLGKVVVVPVVVQRLVLWSRRCRPVVVQRQVPMGFSCPLRRLRFLRFVHRLRGSGVAIILSGSEGCDASCDFAVKRGIFRTPSTRT